MSEEQYIALKQQITYAKQGKQTAFNYLLERFWTETYKFLLAKTKNENEAEDLTIKAFSKAFDHIETYKDKFTFKSWILTIARNLYIDELRRKKNQLVHYDTANNEALDVFDESPSPEDILINEQNLARLKFLIKQLKPHYAQMINLRYFQELSYKEIALEIGEPLNNVKVKLLRARKLLAELIAKDQKNA
ncbi:MAG: RNA polymerase sigma factor [Flavobacteriaceae bacterium]